MDELQRLAAVAALRKMADSGWVDICTIDKIIKIAGVTPDRRAYGILSMLHCINFRDMDAEIRAQLPKLLSDALGGDAIDFEGVLKPQRNPGAVTVLETAQPQKGWLRRLTGGA